jgi:pimeloyl-ACP methyl ester carboxylesterase
VTQQTVDFIEHGSGPTVVLIHSSVAGARQWRSLMETLGDRFRFLAVNLYGYGKTPPWPGPQAQSLLDQAKLLDGLLPGDGSPFAIVGHSFGGAVAMKAAARFGGRVRRLVLLEPNPFYLLKAAGRRSGFAEAEALIGCLKAKGGKGGWPAAAAFFADYWTGPGSWAAMPEDRKAKFAAALTPTFHECDAVMDPGETALGDWAAALPAATTLVSAADTVGAIRDIVGLLQEACPHWRVETLREGGHMAPLTRPDLVNPLIARALA